MCVKNHPGVPGFLILRRKSHKILVIIEKNTSKCFLWCLRQYLGYYKDICKQIYITTNKSLYHVKNGTCISTKLLTYDKKAWFRFKLVPGANFSFPDALKA